MSSYVRTILRDRPVGLWMLDEPSGTIAVDKTNRYGNGTYAASGVTYNVPGPSGKIPRAIATDGAAGDVGIPDAIIFLGTGADGTTTRQSWEVWANLSVDLTTTTVRYLWGNDTSPFRALALGGDATGALTNEVSTVGNDDGGANERTGWDGFTIAAGWHHHVWVFNGLQDGWTYYLDGTDIMGRSGVSKINNASGARGMTRNGSWRLSRFTTNYQAWTGLAAAAVYDKDLSQATIAAHYGAGRA